MRTTVTRTLILHRRGAYRCTRSVSLDMGKAQALRIHATSLSCGFPFQRPLVRLPLANLLHHNIASYCCCMNSMFPNANSSFTTSSRTNSACRKRIVRCEAFHSDKDADTATLAIFSVAHAANTRSETRHLPRHVPATTSAVKLPHTFTYTRSSGNISIKPETLSLEGKQQYAANHTARQQPRQISAPSFRHSRPRCGFP
jgi:hypothetical protein